MVRVQAKHMGVDCGGGCRSSDVRQDQLGPCLVHPENQKVFKILCHIESCGTCMKY